MKDAGDAELLLELANRLATLREERAALLAKLAAASIQKTDSDLAKILRSALASEKGWQDVARQALGDFRWITCEDCGALFPSSGKRRKRCGRC